MRDSCIFYRSFLDAIELLPKKYQLSFFMALFNYALNDEPPKNLAGSAAALFKALQPQLDANTRKYENGCKGGRPKNNQDETKPKPKHNQTETKPKRNVNDNENVNVNVNENENGAGSQANADAASTSLFLIDYLNRRAGTSHVVNETVENLVQDLLDEGYTRDQMRTVIDKKCAEWLNDGKMRGYLRPSTLFGRKFTEYLNAPIPLAAEKQNKAAEEKAALKKQLEEKYAALEDLNEGLKTASREERKILREQIAILEDSIAIIERRV